MPESLSLLLIAWFVLVMVFAGLVHGALGFGFPFVATPLVALASDMHTAVVMVLLPTLATTFINIAMSGPLLPAIRRFWMIPLFSFVGSAIGTTVFVLTPGFPYSLLLAAITLGYLNLDRLGLGEIPLVRRHERAFAPVAGVASGLFEGTTNVAGPPLIIFYMTLGLTPAMMVQGLNICFVVSKSTQLAVMATRGGVSATQWIATLPYAAVGALGFFAGLYIRKRSDTATYRRWVKHALFVIAMILPIQYVYTLFA